MAVDVAIDPADPDRLVLATSDDPFHDEATGNGVWVSADGGKTWQREVGGLPMLRVTCAAFDPRDPARVVIGTFGRGFFQARWPASYRPAGARAYLAVADDAKDAAPAAPQPPADAPVVIRNGGMTQGGPVPGDWTGKFGDVDVSRDTATFKEGPASLKVTAAAGKGGQAFQKLDAQGGQAFTVTGWVRSAGKAKVNVAVQSFDAKFTRNDFKQLKFVHGDADWAKFEAKVTLPDWGEEFHLALLVEGDGSAWLDEVRDARLAVDPGKPVDVLTASAPAKDKPWVPGWGFYPQFPTAWKSHFESQLKRTKEGAAKRDVGVIFLGDSITQGWGDAGKRPWEKNYAPLKAVNFGIGGDSTRQILWRLEHGLVDGLTPKAVVLMIGTNNLYGDFNAGTDEEIAKAIGAIVTDLRKRLPDAKVLVLGILPRQNEFFSGRARAVNALVAKLADGRDVRFLDMTPAFQTAPGKVKPELFVKDQLHLAESGYEAWAAEMAPTLAEMLK